MQQFRFGLARVFVCLIMNKFKLWTVLICCWERSFEFCFSIDGSGLKIHREFQKWMEKLSSESALESCGGVWGEDNKSN